MFVISKEELYDIYIIKKNNIEYVSNKYNVSKDMVKKKLKEYNIHKDRKDIFEQSKEKYKESMLKKYGVEHPIQNENIKDKIKQTNFKKYGKEYVGQVKEFQDKIKQTNLKKYGTEYGLQNNEIRNKIINTNLKKYGVDNPLKNKEIQTKIENTNLKKYGVKNAGGIKESIEKSKKTMKLRYGVSSPIYSEEIKSKMKKTSSEKYGVPYFCMTEECKHANGNTISKINQRFSNLLNQNNISNKLEFVLNQYSYDIKLCDSQTLIEINPTYTHNSTNGCWFNKHSKEPLDKNYHYNKTLEAKLNGYRCIHIWDWDNLDKIIKILKNKENIFARKCVIKNISLEEATKFLENNHLQGSCKGQEIRIGLYYNNELVQLMTFGKPRYNKKYEWELLRLCSNLKYNILGGTEKLFKFFLKNNNPKSIISYCDNSKFNGKVYEKLNFKLKNYGTPSKHWYNEKTKQHITDNLLRQRGYDQLFKTNYGKGFSNEKLMIDNGFVEIYDSGQSTYVFNIK